MLVIHAFLLCLYVTSNDLTFLKHLGFSDYPMTNSLVLSVPVMLAQSKIESLSFDCFPPVQRSPRKCKDLFGWQ